MHTQRLNQEHNQFQQNLETANEDRVTRVMEGRANRRHAEELHKDEILSREGENAARRTEFLTNLAHQSALAKLARESEDRRFERSLEETKAGRQQAHEQFTSAQTSAERRAEAELKQRAAEAVASQNLSKANLAFAKNRFIREMAEKGVDRNIAQTQFEAAARERIEEHAAQMEFNRRQQSADIDLRREQLGQADKHFLENLRETARQHVADLGYRERQHADTMAESQANRGLAREQFEEHVRQAKLQDLHNKRLAIHSMRLANGQESHAQWLNNFNASIAHMGLQLKRDKLDMLIRGDLKAPDENASERDKISWLAGLLSDADAAAGARQDRSASAAASANAAAMHRLGIQERLNQQSHAYKMGVFNNLMMPLTQIYAGTV
jgi:hypothetical protein